MKNIFLIISVCLPWLTFSQNWIPAGSNPGLGSYPVESLFVDTLRNDLYVGGSFKYFKSLIFNGIVRIDSLGALHTLGTALDGCGPYNCTPIKVIKQYKDEIYVGWVDNTINGGTVVNGIARWDGTTWKPLQSGFNQGGVANGFIEYNGDLYISGAFKLTIDSIPQYGIAKWNGASWTGLDFPVYPGDYPLAQASAWYKGKLYLGGGFLFGVGNSYILDIASFDGTKWSAVGEGIKGGIWHGINDMVVFKDELYVCGLFRSVDGNIGNKIMRWDGDQWKDVGGGICDQDATLHRMLVHDGKLYVMGIFTCVGDGIPASCIASWDGDRWCSCGNSIFNNRVFAMAFWQDNLYVGGGFTAIDNKPVTYFAKWVGDHSTDTCSAVSAIKPEPFKNTELRIRPNPAVKYVTFESAAFTGNRVLVRILNSMGVVQIEKEFATSGQSNIQIDIHDLSKGVYFLTVSDDHQKASGKFLKTVD